MFIIFGWGFTTTHLFGAVLPLLCPNCHNEQFWLLRRVRYWFTLFFIPVFPYSSSHRLVCPVCGVGRELTGAELKRAKLFAETNTAFAAGRLQDGEYGRRLEAIAAASSDQLGKDLTSSAQSTVVPAVPPLIAPVPPATLTPQSAARTSAAPSPPSAPPPQIAERTPDDCPRCGRPFEDPADLYCPRCGRARLLAPARN